MVETMHDSKQGTYYTYKTINSSIHDTLFLNLPKKFNIYFDNANATSRDSQMDSIKTYVGKDKVMAVYIDGYCDNNGSDSGNMKLSILRAQFLADYLRRLGVDSSRIKKVKGNGSLHWSMTNKTDSNEGKRLSRKTQVRIVTGYLKEFKPVYIKAGLQVGDKINIPHILFIGGSSTVLPGSVKYLELLAAQLKEFPDYKVCINGHICCLYNGEDGQDMNTGRFNLSEARALTVYKYLIEQGIAAERLTTKGLRGKFPLRKGDAADRRVEVEIVEILNSKK